MIKLVGTISGTLIGLAAIFTFWSDYGWVTRDAYAQDNEGRPTQAQMANIEQLLVEIKDEQVKNQTQWECDETDEEIPELEEDILGAENAREKIELTRDLDKLKEKWTNLNCAQFTD